MWLLEMRPGNYTMKQKMLAMKSAVRPHGSLWRKLKTLFE